MESIVLLELRIQMQYYPHALQAQSTQLEVDTISQLPTLFPIIMESIVFGNCEYHFPHSWVSHLTVINFFTVLVFQSEFRPCSHGREGVPCKIICNERRTQVKKYLY